MKTEYLTRSQFNVIKKYLLCKRGRSWKYDPYHVVNATLHILITGSQWRCLPESYPPYKLVYYHFSKWKQDKVFHLILAVLAKKQDNRLLIIDNQSISDSDLPTKKGKGYDGHKHRKGRKRCLLTDTRGNIHCVRYFPANYHDTICAKNIVEYYRETPLGKRPGLVTIYGDKGFTSPKVKMWGKEYNVSYQYIPRMKKPNLNTKIGYELHKQQYGYLVESIKKVRWVVERTFAWLQKYRRLNLNYERTVSSLEAMTLLAGIRMMLKRF